MIALARADARRFRAVARRGLPPGRPKGPAPPVHIRAEGGTLTLAAHLGEVVVALRAPAPRPGDGSVTVPLDSLAACEGRTGLVTLGPGREGAVTARWADGPDERRAAFDPPAFDPAWPEEPAQLVAMPPHLPTALHEAGRAAAREPGRYAVTRVQLKGQAGEVVGTDGKQALVWGGFRLPFVEDLLVPAVPVFGSKELAAEAGVSLGLAGDWLFLVLGPWRVWLLVDREGRFPDVRAAAPRAAGTRLTVADADARAVLAALPGLPGAAGTARPVTLDLGPRVLVRARDVDAAGPAAEVPLPGSTAAGPPVRLVLDREHLGRALALGFREFRVASPERPVVARAGARLYLAATLDPAGAADPDPSYQPPNTKRRTPVPSRDTPPAGRNGQADPSAAHEPTDPLAEAEGLRAALAAAAARAARLVAALKQHRRERRSLQAAWSSLRQLNLGP